MMDASTSPEIAKRTPTRMALPSADSLPHQRHDNTYSTSREKPVARRLPIPRPVVMGRLSDGAGICPRMNATWRHLATVERAMGILLVVTGFCLLTGSV